MSLLSAPENPFDLFNVRFQRLKEFGVRQQQAHWLDTDIDHSKDSAQFLELPKNVQATLSEGSVAFFYSADGQVFKIDGDLADDIPLPEVKYTYIAFENMEGIHANSYGKQLQSIAPDPVRRKELENSVVNLPSVKRLSEWATVHCRRDGNTLIDRLIGALCIEGIFFQSPFGIIFWIKEHYPGKMNGITSANQIIMRDENLHCEFSVALIRQLVDEDNESLDNAPKIIRSAVEAAVEFARGTIREGLPGLSVALMERHIKSVANRWAQLIGIEVIYPDCVKTPFTFMEKMSLDIKVNFFENTVLEYSKAPNMDNIDFDCDPMLIDF